MWVLGMEHRSSARAILMEKGEKFGLLSNSENKNRTFEDLAWVEG